MKFKVFDNGNTHTGIKFPDWNHFYLTPMEMQSIIEGKLTLSYDGNVMQCTRDTLVIYESALSRTIRDKETVIPLKALVIYCDTRNMFRRIAEAVKRAGSGKEVTLDTLSFRRWKDRIPHEELNFCQIVSHPRFSGHNALYYAIRKGIGKGEVMKNGWEKISGIARDTFPMLRLMHLRQQLSQRLQMGYNVANDWPDTPNFYFWDETKSLGVFNGGLIYSEHFGWSIHTWLSIIHYPLS